MKELYFDALKDRKKTHLKLENIRFINIVVMNILSTDLFKIVNNGLYRILSDQGAIKFINIFSWVNFL